MTRNYDAMLSPSQCSQRCDSQKGLKRERPTQSKLKAKQKTQIDPMRPKSYHVYNWDKKCNHLTPVATFDRNLKGLVPVGNRHFVAGEDIPDVPRDCVPCTYYLIFFQKIKKRFELSEVSTLTPTDGLGPTVRSTNVGTRKIDGPTFKLLVWFRWKISLKKPVYFSKRRFQ